jgi:hypothetical protein
MSSLVQLNPSGEMEAKIIELKNIMQTRRGFNKSKAKLTNTFGGSKNHRYMFNRSNSNFGITDKFNKQTHSIEKGNYSMWNAPNNNKHQDILKLLREIMHLKDPDFRYSTIQVNAPVLVNRSFESNTVSQWHKDTGNMRNAQSYGFSFGDFECNSEPTTGAVGDLWTRDEDGNITVIDYHNKPTKFDAQKVEHRTNPNIEGKRWAVLYFTSEHAIEIDVLLNYEYLIKKDTTQQEPQYLQWLNDVPNLSQQHRDYIKANEDEFKRVYETRQLKLQDKYQIKTDKKFVIWKKLNLFVINLERCKDKRKHMDKNLKQEGFTNYAFFEAVNGLKLVEDPAYTYDYKDTKLINQKVFRSGFNTEGHYDCIGPTGNAGHSWKKTPVVLGEIGCAMSHFDIWKHAWDNDFSNVMVMEDDVNFDHDFFDFDCFQIPHDVELIQLGWEGKGSKNGPNLNKLYYQNVEQSNPFGHFIEYDKDHSIVLNHCYIIPNRDALKKLIDLYKPYYPGSMDEPAKKLQNHALDIVMDKIVYPQLNICLLKNAIKQKRKQGIFRSDIRGSHIKNHQFESKEQVNDDETKGDDNNNNIEVAMPKKLPSGDSLVTAMDELSWDSDPAEYIYIGFLIRDGDMKGGWRSMTAHLYHCLKYYYDEKIINIKPIVVRTHGSLKTGLIGKNKTDFGYGITSERMSIHDLARKKNVLLMAVGKNGSEKKGGKGYSELELFKGHSIVVHDINEVTRYVNAKNNRNYLKDMKVIVLGQHLKEVLLKNYGIRSRLIKQPFYKFPTYNVNKTKLISTARVEGRKNHNIILEANHVASEHLLYDNTPGEEHWYRAHNGLIRIRSALAPKAEMQTISKYTEDQKKQFKACYEGGFEMSFEATAKTYADALALVDMSMFKAKQGDGGRTQYTFLEAIHCDCMLILHDTWLKYPGPFTKGVNCQTIANAEELASLSCKLAYDLKKVYYDVEDGKLVPYSYEPNEVKEFGKENEPNLLNFVYDHYVSNAKKILPQHDNGHVWMNNILKSYHEFYSKAVEKELPEPEVAVEEELPEPEVAVEEELPKQNIKLVITPKVSDGNSAVTDDETKEVQYGIQDPRCAPNDMWGTPPEFKREHGYDETWFDPCPYPPAEWDATEVDWFKFKDCKKNGNKFFVNPPYKKQFRIPFFEKIVETFNEAKEKNLDIKIHCLIPSDFPKYMKPFMKEAIGWEGIHDRPHFTNLHTGVVAGAMPKDSMLVFYEHTKVLEPINHTNDDIVIVNNDEEDDHELEFDPMKCYVGGLGSVNLSKNKPADFDYQHYQELRGLKKKKSEIKPEVKLVNVKNNPLSVDVLKQAAMEREQRRGVPSYKRSEMANDNNNNNRIMKYDDIGKKIKKKKKTSWRSLGKGESLKGNVVKADPIIGQKILWKGDDGEDWLGKIVSYTRRKYEIKFDDFEDDGNKLVSKSAAQQLIQFYKDKYKYHNT